MKRFPPALWMFPIMGIVALSLFGSVRAARAGQPLLLPDTEATPRMAEWQKLHYGMFISFGMSTFTGAEIDNGKAPSTTYAPTQLDVDQWIRVAKAAGMTYAVLTSKHVSGHCLWDSKVMWRGKPYDYDVATSGNTTDVIAAFVKACAKYGIRPGLYYCMMDCRNNSVPSQQQWTVGKLPDDYYQLVQDQLSELITRYPAIHYYWLDIPRAASAEQRARLYDLARRLNPSGIVLFNAGLGGKYFKPALTVQNSKGESWPTDVLTSERFPANAPFTHSQTWDGKTFYLGYEHCDCLGNDWFWTAKDTPRPDEELFALYDQVVNDLGGNLLLDVGPDRRGRIDEPRIAALTRLKAMIDAPQKYHSLTRHGTARASTVWQNDPQYSAAMAIDGRSDTRWASHVRQARIASAGWR